jgi:hypothetical protein
MADFVFVPGAGGVAWYWHRVVPLLEEAGHDAIAVDLLGDDEQAGLSAYADRVFEVIGGSLQPFAGVLATRGQPGDLTSSIARFRPPSPWASLTSMIRSRKPGSGIRNVLTGTWP